MASFILSRAVLFYLNCVALLLDSFECDGMTQLAVFDPVASYSMKLSGCLALWEEATSMRILT